MRLIVGMTGATGAPLGVALLQALREMPNVETHLVMSKWAKPPLNWKRLTTPAMLLPSQTSAITRRIRPQPSPQVPFVPMA
ncbi:hypothetical protein FA039_20180 [Escherichia coli]|nr:hypothetical protein [Escherichia coli]